MSNGEVNLNRLLEGLSPELVDGDFVFVTVSEETWQRSQWPVRGLFHEQEGVTLILLKEVAENEGLRFDGVFRQITCQVHSSLEAVGMTAAMATALTHHGISANVVAAYYHDHLFVPATKAQEAVSVLSMIAKGKG
ncbi:ACT domain-containing protein [Aestuariibacter sp. A3R04]|uniref:ACT domain-containing protein n=1 Tax=Aestuariibacter sp. A3R04 TaxID=2841571 RepID=UPI001C08A03A|nr:ACT domain-containing protein [Aestuariibacter sp. A3R04]MBU3023560.1 ACT domain-containing protein [Aestuariibacter sp. A3R04]